jgi:predicted ester cyclase
MEVIPVSVEATKRVMDAYLSALTNRGDFGQFFTDNVSWTTIETGDRFEGREAVRDFITTFHTQLFDAHSEVKSPAIGDGIVALEADFVGTHTGEFAGIAPTGASLRVPYAVFFEVADDGIKALRAYMPISRMVADCSSFHGVPELAAGPREQITGSEHFGARDEDQ